jgi:hypothetical protein
MQQKLVIHITKDIDQSLIHCSLVSSSYQNNLKSDVIYAFTPNISPRSLINIEPTHPKYLPINRTDYTGWSRYNLPKKFWVIRRI